ncbi:hypothetical protein A2U01_0004999, partial [Trifolium medium]|nr:hypothetical protein [Trifolium medium]
ATSALLLSAILSFTLCSWDSREPNNSSLVMLVRSLNSSKAIFTPSNLGDKALTIFSATDSFDTYHHKPSLNSQSCLLFISCTIANSNNSISYKIPQVLIAKHDLHMFEPVIIVLPIEYGKTCREMAIWLSLYHLFQEYQP